MPDLHAESIKHDLVTAYSSLTTDDPIGRQELAHMILRLRSWLESPDHQISPAAIQCVTGFVRGELDFVTPGDRGPGRSSTYWPRLAARHRPFLSQQSSSRLSDLSHAIEKHILCGYLFCELMYDLERALETPVDARALYEDMWMQIMYSPPFKVRRTDEDFVSLERLWFCATGNYIRSYFQDAGITWVEKDTGILTEYFTGGMLLRVIESMTPDERSRIGPFSGTVALMENNSARED